MTPAVARRPCRSNPTLWTFPSKYVLCFSTASPPALRAAVRGRQRRERVLGLAGLEQRPGGFALRVVGALLALAGLRCLALHRLAFLLALLAHGHARFLRPGARVVNAEARPRGTPPRAP